MKIFAGVSGVDDVLARADQDARVAITSGMREAQEGLLAEYREQVREAGMGNRLANSWRGQTYPNRSGRNSLNPSGYVWSEAPKIVGFFSAENSIVPLGGHPYLAIPTDKVPLARGSRSSRQRMSPFEVETAFNQDLKILKGRGSNLLGFVDVIGAKGGKGYRPRTAGRVAQGRQSKLVLMFTFVRRVQGRKIFDLDGPAQRWAGRVPDLVAKHWTR